ncbi:MAG: hypothetical protein WBA74_20700, partial [Cyclobacteriaceae bacterium]
MNAFGHEVEKLTDLAYNYRINTLYDSAISINDSILKNNPPAKYRVSAFLENALCNIEIRMLSKAFEYIKKAENIISRKDLSAENPKYYYVLARYLNLTGGNKAKFYFQKSLRFLAVNDPFYIETSVIYSDYLIETNDLKNAEKILRKAFKFQKLYHLHNTYLLSRILLQYGYFLYKKNELEKSISCYDKILKPLLITNYDKRWAKFLYAESIRLKAWPLRALGDYQEALNNNKVFLNQITQLFDNQYFRVGEVYQSISIIYDLLGNIELATEYVNQSIQFAIENKNASRLLSNYYSKALLLYKEKKYIKCIITARKIESLYKNTYRQKYYSSLLLYFIAQSQFNLGKTDSALKTIEKCIFLRKEVRPENLYYSLPAYDVKIKYLLSIKDIEEAQSIFTKIKSIVDLDDAINYPKLLQFFIDYSEYLLYNGYHNECKENLYSINVWFKVFSKRYPDILKNSTFRKYFKEFYLVRSNLFNEKYKSDRTYENVKLAFNDLKIYYE